MALTSNLAYGFIMDKNPTVTDLPSEYQTFVALTGLVTISKGVKVPSCGTAGFVEVLELILFGSYPKLEIGFPVDESNEDIVVYAIETHQSAINGAKAIEIKPPSPVATDQINALAAIFGKEAGWVSYPTNS